MSPLAVVKAQLMYVTVASLVKVVTRAGFDINPADGIALGIRCFGEF